MKTPFLWTEGLNLRVLKGDLHAIQRRSLLCSLQKALRMELARGKGVLIDNFELKELFDVAKFQELGEGIIDSLMPNH